MKYFTLAAMLRRLAISAALVACWPVAAASGGDRPTTRPLAGKLVCVGASITEGSLASKPELAYVGRLAAMAAAAHDDLKVVNEGRSGWSTGAYAYNAIKLADKLPADTTLITIELGTNDLREKGTPDKIARTASANLERLIKAYRAKVPRATVIIVTPTAVYPAKFIQHLRDTGYDETGPAKLVAIDAAYRVLARKLGLQLIDLSDLPAMTDTPEGVHPDDRGHAAIAERIWRGLTEGSGLPGPATRAAVDPGTRMPARFDRPDVQARVGVCCAGAADNLLDRNTVRPANAGN